MTLISIPGFFPPFRFFEGRESWKGRLEYKPPTVPIKCANIRLLMKN